MRFDITVTFSREDYIEAVALFGNLMDKCNPQIVVSDKRVDVKFPIFASTELKAGMKLAMEHPTPKAINITCEKASF